MVRTGAEERAGPPELTNGAYPLSTTLAGSAAPRNGGGGGFLCGNDGFHRLASGRDLGRGQPSALVDEHVYGCYCGSPRRPVLGCDTHRNRGWPEALRCPLPSRYRTPRASAAC